MFAESESVLKFLALLKYKLLACYSPINNPEVKIFAIKLKDSVYKYEVLKVDPYYDGCKLRVLVFARNLAEEDGQIELLVREDMTSLPSYVILTEHEKNSISKQLVSLVKTGIWPVLLAKKTISMQEANLSPR